MFSDISSQTISAIGEGPSELDMLRVAPERSLGPGNSHSPDKKSPRNESNPYVFDVLFYLFLHR
jgi:hypothetical protein